MRPYFNEEFRPTIDSPQNPLIKDNWLANMLNPIVGGCHFGPGALATYVAYKGHGWHRIRNALGY